MSLDELTVAGLDKLDQPRVSDRLDQSRVSDRLGQQNDLVQTTALDKVNQPGSSYATFRTAPCSRPPGS